MLTIQKNELFESIRQTGLDPALFRLDDSPEGLTTIRVSGFPLQFDIRRSDDSFDSVTYRFNRFAPDWPYSRPQKPRNYASMDADRKAVVDEEIAGGWIPAEKWCSFRDMASAFRSWLTRDVKPALANAVTPDLWAEAAAGLPAFEELPPEETEPFTPDEQVQIRAAISHFTGLVERQFAPDPEQTRELVARLDYLADAVARLNRFDWKSLALATVIGAASTLSLDTQRGRELWALFREALRAVSHLLGP